MLFFRLSTTALVLAWTACAVACAEADDGSGGSSSSSSASGMPPTPLVFTFVLQGHGKVSIGDNSFACGEDKCTGSLNVDAASIPVQIEIVPDNPDWVPATSTLDGGPAPNASSAHKIVVDGNADHTLEVAFAQILAIALGACSAPTASTTSAPLSSSTPNALTTGADVAHAINALSGSHPHEVEEAISFLVARPAEAVPALIAALAGRSAVPAASLLGRMGALEAVPALTSAARDGGPGLRWQAGQALAQIRQIQGAAE